MTGVCFVRVLLNLVVGFIGAVVYGISRAVRVRSGGLSYDFPSRLLSPSHGVFKHRVHLFVVDFVSVFVFGVANEYGVGGVDENHGEVTQGTPDDEPGD
tara:strand:- start:24 stop:320 length:297 start_codon:yes stop_codon:yes gene_type:complete